LLCGRRTFEPLFDSGTSLSLSLSLSRSILTVVMSVVVQQSGQCKVRAKMASSEAVPAWEKKTDPAAQFAPANATTTGTGDSLYAALEHKGLVDVAIVGVKEAFGEESVLGCKSHFTVVAVLTLLRAV